MLNSLQEQANRSSSLSCYDSDRSRRTTTEAQQAAKGFTLVESLVAMTVGSSLMLLGIGLLHQSLNLSKRVALHGRHELATTRLVSQFRSDVHATLAVATVAENSIEFVLEQQQRLTYSVNGHRVERRITLPDGKLGHDHYELADHYKVAFKLNTTTNRVELILMRASQGPDSVEGVEMRVDAAVGRWREITGTRVTETEVTGTQVTGNPPALTTDASGSRSSIAANEETQP